jgi:hypothetical protein
LRLVVKRLALIAVLWVPLTAATVRCSGGTFGDDDDDDDPDFNRPPVASASFLQTPLGEPVSDRMRATDPDGDPLTFRVTAGPDRGSLSRLDDRGFFSYVPADVGSDQFLFRASDGRLDSNEAQVVIRVTAFAGAAGAAKAQRRAGIALALADPAADALLVLWTGAQPALERVPRVGAGPVRMLLSRVAAVAADPWRPGRLLALSRDGELFESEDAGGRWRPLARLRPPASHTALAVAGDRLVIARTAGDCETRHHRLSGLRVDEVCGRSPSVGPDGTAYVLTATSPAALHVVGGSGAALASGVLRAAADPLRPAGVWLVLGPESAPVLRYSADAGASWRDGPRPPPGRLIDALAHPAGAGLWLGLGRSDGTVGLYRLEEGRWIPAAALPGPAERMFDCGGGVCVLDAAGRRLWRVAGDARLSP